MDVQPPDHAGARDRAEAAERGLRARYNLIALLRLICFGGLAVAVAASIQAPGPLALASLCACGIAFFILALWHGRIDDRRRLAAALAAYHVHGVDRLAGRWNHGQNDGSALVGADHPYAGDLDLVGPGGLYALLNTAAGDEGEAVLAEWLFDGTAAGFAEAGSRSAAIRQLLGEHGWRADLVAAATLERGRRGADDPLPRWLVERGAAGWRRWSPLIWLARAVVVGLLIWSAMALTTEGFLLTGLCLAMVCWMVDRVAVQRACPEPDAARRLAQSRADALATLARAPGDDPGLQALREEAQVAATGLGELAEILDAHAKRANALRAMLGALLLVEWHNLDRLWRWADAHGTRREAWLRCLGHGQALASLATYAVEQGGCWPELVAEGPLIAATDLAHALLPKGERVGNDIELHGGQVLLLTGANASGKSTFIRALCLALVLARLGVPVPAASCRLRAMRLATVMRVTDDLRAGRSRFQAEVERLKLMLDRLAEDGAPMCLALDEILGGTNSRERHLGTQAVLDHARGSAGLVLVSTHDLELARLADADPERFVLAHFADRAALGETSGDMVFDYQLRPGVLQSTNALRVMKAYGLPVPE